MKAQPKAINRQIYYIKNCFYFERIYDQCANHIYMIFFYNYAAIFSISNLLISIRVVDLILLALLEKHHSLRM